MGAEESILDGCDLEEGTVEESCPWVLRHGQLADDTLITILSDQNCDRTKRELFQRNVKNLKSLRHPSIVRFLASGDQSSHAYIVVERVVPVLTVLETHSAIEICAGLFSVLEGLSFLHEKAGICHNNVCLESVFVTDTGYWKLGSLEHACKFGMDTSQYLTSAKNHRSSKAIAPEERDESMTAAPELAFARDVYAFGVMVEELLEKLEDLGEIIGSYEIKFEFKIWISRNQYHNFSSQETVGKCLTRSLLCRFVLLDLDAKRHLIPNLLMPYHDGNRPAARTGEATPLFSVSTFRTYVVPEIYRVFHCHDYNIRMILLTYLRHYVNLFEKESLEDVILPQVLLGLRDTNEDLAALSLRSLAELVPLLGRQTVIGGKAKTYFKKGMPKSVQRQHHQSNGDQVFNSEDVISTKEGVFSSVNEVMGKPLLKDLAKLSKTHTVAVRENEAEIKRKAREQRLQDAKLKRERRRQEKQMKSEKITVSEGDEIVGYGVEELSEDLTTETTDHTHRDVSGSDENLASDIRKDQDPEDWTGWDDTNEEQFDVDDSELSQFESVIDDLQTKHVISDDERVMESTGVFLSESTDWDSDWSAANQINNKNTDSICSPNNDLQNSLSVTGKSSSALSLKSVKKPKPSIKTRALGSEYIMDIEVKKIQAEKEVCDFFADMTPHITHTISTFSGNTGTTASDIGTATTVVRDAATAGTDVKEARIANMPLSGDKSTSTISMKYNVAETENVTEGGWGEDEGWGDDGGWGED
ncbi:protein-associating with the carboxyl-terminal domain of ezrin-like [Ylistrum balloti]|uniref:protein-associating with the carboxyl-terminal domain of ezrin-like n=1 Tax=Ylistrum balloti TaxID=509963 RepID=UPI002905DD25|nr:protein-associating with the carboxyl-terminal domain of ezrin-like [Ylistrum balloti]